MRRFTRLLTLLFMVCIVGVANAKTEKAHATFAAPTNTSAIWNAADSSFTWQQTSYNQIRNIGLPTGDITMYKKLVVDCEVREGSTFRILVYKGGSNLTLWAKDGVNEFILADTLKTLAPDDYNSYLKECSEICLSGSNAVATGEVKINDIYLETYDNEGVKTYATFAAPSNTSAIWNAADSSFTWKQTSYNQIRNIGLPTGDITMYKKLVVDCEVREGSTFRILVYKGGSNLTLWAKDGVNEFILADTLKTLAPDDYNSYLKECSEICLSGSNAVATGEVKINSIYLETYPENESVEIPDVQYEEDPGKPAGDFVDFTEAFPELQPRIGLGADEHPIELGNGDVVVGQRTKDVIADLSAYSKLTIVTSPNLKLVLYMNHEIDAKQNAGEYTEDEAGKYVFMDVQANENGIIEVDLTQFEKQDLNAICLPWDNSNKGTVWYLLLTKGEAAPVGQEVTFDFNASNHAVSNEGNEGDITVDEVNTVDGVVMTISPADEGANTPNRYWKYQDAPQLRMYSGKMTIEAPEGKAITKVVINNGKWNTENTFNGEAAAEGNWEGNSTNVIFAVAGNTQMNSVVVTLADKNEETTTYEEPAKPAIAEGTYYLYNVGAAGYLVGANNWGTRASIAKAGGLEVEAVMTPDGKYELKTASLYAGKHLGFNGYVDNGDESNWTIAPVEGQEGVFTLTATDDKVLFWDGGEATTTSVGAMPTTAENAYWKIISSADRMAQLATATAENPVDATFLISNPSFGRNASNAAWKMEASNKNLSGGTDENRCAESFHAVFTLSQALKNAPAGKYQMTAQGFYRQDGEDNDNLPYFYANDSKGSFPLKTGTENSMNDASASFDKGEYTIEPIEVTVFEDGGLTIGAKLENNTNLWCIFDNFQLTYLTSEIPADEFKPAYEAALAAAQAALANENYAAVTGTEKAALEKAIADNTTVEETVDAYKAAISALNAATEAFTGAKADYEALPAAKEAVKDLTFKYATAEKKAAAEATLTAEATSAADAKTKVAAIENAYRQYAESSALLEGVEGSGLCTDSIVNPNAEDGINGWTLTGKANTKSNESFIDGDGKKDYKYFDSDQWGDNSWDISLTQKIALPAGKYQLTVTGRASADVDMKVFAGTDSATVASIGATNGLYTFGWNDASVEFELAEADSVVIGVRGVTSANHNWMSFTRFRLAIFEAPIEVQPDDPEPAVPEGWESVIANGNMAGDDVSSFFKVEPGVDGVQPAVIEAGIGKNNSRGIVVKSADAPANDWATQLFIKASKVLPAGTKIRVEFDYRSSVDGQADTQAHNEPSQYIHWACIGSPNFTGEWQHFKYEGTVPTQCDGSDNVDQETGEFKYKNDFLSIAFNLAKNKKATEFYFDNIVFVAEKPSPVEPEWVDLVVNGDLEGESMECFYVTEQGVGGPFLAVATEGIGVDGSKAVKVQTADSPATDWDSQFFVRLPYQLPAGTKFKFSFDYKSDVAGSADTQCHNEPGQYIHYTCAGSPSFTTEWKHYEQIGFVANECDGSDSKNDAGEVLYKKDFQTIAFNLAKNKKATEFIFDNVKFEVEESIVSSLTKDPAVNPEPYPVGIMTVNAPTIEGAVYDLQGRRVATPAKGLYIVNGKKVMVK